MTTADNERFLREWYEVVLLKLVLESKELMSLLKADINGIHITKEAQIESGMAIMILL